MGSGRPIWLKILYFFRDLHAARLYDSLRARPCGDVLDIGGGQFYAAASARSIAFRSWTVAEYAWDRPDAALPHGVRIVRADGQALPLPSNRFDTVLVIQVLDDVFEPMRLMREAARVLKPNGRLVLLASQTGTMHDAPAWYGNVSKYWIERALAETGLSVESLSPVGGFWQTLASRMIHFFFHATRRPGMSYNEPRSFRFYLLAPLMALWAAISIPVMMLLSWGDLTEEANNLLAIGRKPSA